MITEYFLFITKSSDIEYVISYRSYSQKIFTENDSVILLLHTPVAPVGIDGGFIVDKVWSTEGKVR